MNKPIEPTKEWEYRGMTCRVYRLGEIAQIGYVLVGDVWHQVVETEDAEKDLTDSVESEVDHIINMVTLEEPDNTGDDLFDDDGVNPITPDPIDPSPRPIDPSPSPFDPYDDDDDDGHPLGGGPVWYQTAESFEWTEEDVDEFMKKFRESVRNDDVKII